MAVQTEYWLTTSKKAKISEKELEAINFIKDVFRHDVHAYAISPTTASPIDRAAIGPIFAGDPVRRSGISLGPRSE